MRPNVLIYMTDQQRGDTVFPYNKAVAPNVEEFAKEGVAFDSAYTVAPHCCPSRVSLFSGLFPSQHGVWNNVDVGNAISRGPFDEVKLFSESFQEAGYRTYYSGKWHVSNYESPEDKGFDMYSVYDNYTYSGERTNLGPVVYEWEGYRKYKEQLQRNEAEIIRRGYDTYTHYKKVDSCEVDDTIINCGIEILLDRENIDKKHSINKSKDAPWLQVISSNAPHDPYYVPQQFLDLYNIEDIQLPNSYKDMMEDKPALYRRTADKFRQLTEDEYKESIRHYLALCSYQDYNFGRVLEALKSTGEIDNTIVIYLSDHGDYMGEHGLWCKGLPCFEGAYHIPMIVRYPEGIQAPSRVVKDFVSITDIAPTLLELCNVGHDRKLTGTSLVPYLLNKEVQNKQEEVYTQSNGNELYGIQRSVKTRQWKYVYNGFDYDELYDLTNDPDEMVNLYDKYKDSQIVKDLSKKLWEFAYKTNDVCINPYIMVGLASYGPGIIFE